MRKRTPRKEDQLGFDFSAERSQISTAEMESPRGYTGFYRFHKYWGKKPHEPLAYIIEQLTSPGDIVLDPFCGSGTAGREALLRSRKFVGFDINPVALEITRLLIHPPPPAELRNAAGHLAEAARPEILKSYLLEDGTSAATHYLWNADELEKVWLVGRGAAGRRQELPPTAHDRSLSDSFAGYHSKLIRQPRFFTNSRINAAPEMSLDAVLTGRAQRNIDLLLQAIERCPASIRPALKLCLTAASGQMTQMVFAVTGRGKTTGISSEKTEVGSWVIGYWRPKLHFEVNAWNCFEKRTGTLLKAIACDRSLNSSRLAASVSELVGGNADALLTRGDCRSLLGTLPDECVQLVITDPPHSDRMPYLELSELWNSILGVDVDFAQEIVISNAKERGKTSSSYRESMMEFLSQVPRVLNPDGVLVLLYNSSEAEEWEAFRAVCEGREDGDVSGLRYLGIFPCNYSARSVVQDNRKGSLPNDLALVFCKGASLSSNGHFLRGYAGIRGYGDGDTGTGIRGRGYGDGDTGTGIRGRGYGDGDTGTGILRIELAGGLYHLMSRGNERRPIVRDDADRQRRLDWLQRTVEKASPRHSQRWRNDSLVSNGVDVTRAEEAEEAAGRRQMTPRLLSLPKDPKCGGWHLFPAKVVRLTGFARSSP